jgi:hypothetical protein
MLSNAIGGQVEVEVVNAHVIFAGAFPTPAASIGRSS